MSDTDRDRMIRARAHEIWESEGCPEGQEAMHWARAEAEVDAMSGTAAKADADAGDQTEEADAPSAVAGPAARRRAKS